jgi:hypothetical protein
MDTGSKKKQSKQTESHSGRDPRGVVVGSSNNTNAQQVPTMSATNAGGKDDYGATGLNTTLTFFSHLPPFKGK